MQLSAGAQLGPYRIENTLGAGGMGVVYRAIDTRLNRSVAVKVLSPDLADSSARRRFQHEARMASALNHPHIVTIHETGEIEHVQYLVEEFVDDGTLRDWMRREPRTWRQIATLLLGVADGLAAAHQAGILHRDVKPENILVAKSGYAKLSDFGLAKLDEPTPDFVTRVATKELTRAGLVLGTVPYMSPEQATGRPLDTRSDVFSFGIVLYEALAGRRPFAGTNDVDVLHAVVHRPPDALPSDFPVGLRMLVEKALEKDPADRYQSMRELVIDLRRVVRQVDQIPESVMPAPVGTSAVAVGRSRVQWRDLDRVDSGRHGVAS